MENVLPCGCRDLAIDEGGIGPSAAVWPPCPVCPCHCELTREASNVAIVWAVVRNIIVKRIYGSLTLSVCVCCVCVCCACVWCVCVVRVVRVCCVLCVCEEKLLT